jgi:hypothetical protein
LKVPYKIDYLAIKKEEVIYNDSLVSKTMSCKKYVVVMNGFFELASNLQSVSIVRKKEMQRTNDS